MTRTVALLAFLTAGTPQSEIQPLEGRWVAYSRTATAITGDVALTATEMRAANVVLPWRFVTTKRRFGMDGEPVVARILALTPPSNPELLNGNKLGCDKPIRWVVAWRWERGLAMAVFDSASMPTSNEGTGFCASYYYVRPSGRKASA